MFKETTRWLGCALWAAALGAGILGCGSFESKDSDTDVEEDAASGEDAEPRGFPPPPISDTEWHRVVTMTAECIDCHASGEADAPKLVHKDLPDVYLDADCWECHIPAWEK